MEPRMEPDGRTRMALTPAQIDGIFKDTAAAMRRLAEQVASMNLPDPRFTPPSNERPWHKHTLPNRRRRK